MSLLKTMIKHTAGGQEASARCEPPSLPPQPPQPAIYVSTGLVFKRPMRAHELVYEKPF